MERGQFYVLLYRVLDEKQEVLINIEGIIFYQILSIGNISHSKEHLLELRSQGRDVLNVCNSFLYYFSIEQTLHFLEFVE